MVWTEFYFIIEAFDVGKTMPCISSHLAECDPKMGA